MTTPQTTTTNIFLSNRIRLKKKNPSARQKQGFHSLQNGKVLYGISIYIISISTVYALTAYITVATQEIIRVPSLNQLKNNAGFKGLASKSGEKGWKLTCCI